jgi:multidrug efflux pump subunit AcrA (membrane-fusion protein)
LHNSILNYETSLASAEDNLNQARVNLGNAKISASNALNSVKLSGSQQISAAQSRLDSALNSLSVSERNMKIQLLQLVYKISQLAKLKLNRQSLL